MKEANHAGRYISNIILTLHPSENERVSQYFNSESILQQWVNISTVSQ